MNAITRTSQVSTAPVLRPQSFAELERFAVMAAKSSLVPKDFVGRPENIMLAVQMGSEIGLSPMQAIQNIAVVNGRPSLWGDAMIGVCRASPVFEDINETIEGDGDNMVAVCTAKRVGSSPVTARFSVADAKKAQLWNKQGPWTQYPRRMLQMRARGFCLRDVFPDVLRGLGSAEENQDIPQDNFRGTTIEVPTEMPQQVVTPSKAEKVAAGVEALISRYRAADSMAAVEAINSDPKVGTQMEFLNANYPEHAERVVEAMNEASSVLEHLGEPAEEPAS